MSRCFPYPPPGYELSRAKIESLIDSVKEKQRKKEKRREKRKEREDNTNKETVKSTYIGQMRREEETRPLDRSSVTEEHDFPVPSSSSDSTQNSYKTKKHRTSSGSVTGKVILIRLPSNEKNEPGYLANEQPLCSISAVSVQQLDSLYKYLLEDCLPLRTDQYAQSETEDLEWLMQSKDEDVRTRKRQRYETGDCVRVPGSLGVWPRAEYLHEIGAYALPFTVPY